jgi:hypothetical protein
MQIHAHEGIPPDIRHDVVRKVQGMTGVPVMREALLATRYCSS